MLHGELKVNNEVIGSWKAVRKSNPEFEGGTATYQVTYNRHGEVWTDRIQHNPDDGAERLALTVMAFASVKMRALRVRKKNSQVIFMNEPNPKPPQEEEE